ncbi:hypothetical protein K474DRAFT_1644269, partial [Panus rudis PR-1116 ss-1]
MSPSHRRSPSSHPQQSPPKPSAFPQEAEKQGPKKSIPINEPNAQPEKKSSAPKQSPVTQEQKAAAEKILNFYREHFPQYKALKTISSINDRFDKLKSSFHLPAVLDYQLDNDTIISVDTQFLPLPPLSALDEDKPEVPPLAYTPTNAPLHQYYEELNRLLTALDAVESHGVKAIREKRRDLARRVEREAERVERWK